MEVSGKQPELAGLTTWEDLTESEALSPQGGMSKFFLDPPADVSPFSVRDWLPLLIHPTLQTRTRQIYRPDSYSLNSGPLTSMYVPMAVTGQCTSKP